MALSPLGYRVETQVSSTVGLECFVAGTLGCWKPANGRCCCKLTFDTWLATDGFVPLQVLQGCPVSRMNERLLSGMLPRRLNGWIEGARRPPPS
ncbi:hypothetical protein HNO88_004199 [Novosphingobium chloroacetimidivorans]|uniref:Uncharacterized protein n=1 Tax=Novosphingobium chloroacetimidivorans TaxID=1428314 RepID=A0A7W7NYS9_9SPHN|nr:hypothetical protein [Novosphingobium chloroacetimidivorans]